MWVKVKMCKVEISIIPKNKLIQTDYQAIIELCSRAYEEDYAPFMASVADSVHVLAKLAGKLISHATWITRWIQIGDSAPFRTAYVEGVATAAKFRGCGYASAVMTRLQAEIQEFELGGLSPAETSLYSRLGWEYWQGLLYGRRGDALIPFPEDGAMIFRLPKTPKIDLCAQASIEWRQGEVW